MVKQICIVDNIYVKPITKYLWNKVDNFIEQVLKKKKKSIRPRINLRHHSLCLKCKTTRGTLCLIPIMHNNKTIQFFTINNTTKKEHYMKIVFRIVIWIESHNIRTYISIVYMREFEANEFTLSLEDNFIHGRINYFIKIGLF